MAAELKALGAPPTWLGADAVTRSQAALESGVIRETWKYSSLSKTLRGMLGAPPASQTPLPDVPDGVSVTRLSALAEPPRLELNIERYPLAGITASLAGDGWLIDVERSPDRPILLSSAPGINAPVIVRVHPGCQVEIEEGAAIDGVVATVRMLLAGQDTKVSWAQAELATDAEQWWLLQATLAENGSLDLYQHASGARLRRLDTQVTLKGDGASCRCIGASVAAPGGHLDRQQVVEHIGRHTKSRTKLHNLAAGRSRCSFNGRIHIHPGAKDADADLSNKNLALDVDAEINTKPELEIYTDDVRCAHGATVGQLDDNALFYLQSRGLPEPLARRILSIGFLATCVTGPASANVLQHFLQQLDGLPGHLAGGPQAVEPSP